MSEGMNFERCVPRHRADLAIEIFKDQIVASHKNGEKITHLNSTASFILALIDGVRDIDDIITEVSDRYPEARATAGQDVRATIDFLIKHGLVSVAR